MTFSEAVADAARVILETQGETVECGDGSALTVVFYPLTEDEKVSGGRRVADLTRGLIYPASHEFNRGDVITQTSGRLWTVLPDENLTREGDAVGGLKRARVVFKGINNV